MANPKDITKNFLQDVSEIRKFDLEHSFIHTPDAKRLLNEKLKNSITDLSEAYTNLLEPPEKEYLESLKNFYGVGDKKIFDYSKIEAGKTLLDTPMQEFYGNHMFSVRVENSLKENDICYLGELVQCGEKDLLKFKGFGEKSLKEIKEIVAEEGYSLGMFDINYVRPEKRN